MSCSKINPDLCRINLFVVESFFHHCIKDSSTYLNKCFYFRELRTSITVFLTPFELSLSLPSKLKGFGCQESPPYFDFQISFLIELFEKWLIHLFHSSLMFLLIWVRMKTYFLLMRVQEKTKIKFGVDFKCISEEECVKLKLEGVDQVVREGYVDLS